MFTYFKTLSKRLIEKFSHAQDPAIDVRQSLWERIPQRWQALVTQFTGKAHHDQPQPSQWHWYSRLGFTLVIFAGSIGASVVITQNLSAAWLLLPIGWLLTTGAAQALQTNFAHYAAHGALSGLRTMDKLIGELLTTLILIGPLARYTPNHRKHHGKLATTEDADLRFLTHVGFTPGKSREHYWHMLFRLVVSPSFHWQFSAARLRANLVRASAVRKLVAWTYVLGLIVLAGASQNFIALLLGWFVPVILLLNISLLLQLLTEHTWVWPTAPDTSVRLATAKITHGRFVGEAAPDVQRSNIRSIVAWSKWALRMVFVHAPQRWFVVPGDLPNHDWHHRNPSARLQWPNAAYARRDDQQQPAPQWPPYTEHWGLVNWLNKTFDALASLPAQATLGEPSTYTKPLV